MTLVEQLRKIFARTASAASAPVASKPSQPARPSASRLPDASLTPRSVRVTLGLDFGTSSTKAIVNFEDDAAHQGHFAVIQQTDGNEVSLLYPSAVAFRDGVLLTGGQANLCADAIRSFKMCIPCACVRRATRCANCPADDDGRYRIGGHTLDAIDVSVLYLAIVIKHAKTELSRHKPDCRFTWHMNCAAPLDQLEADPRLRAAFERVFYHAWKLSEQVQSNWPLEDAMAALNTVVKEFPILPTTESPIMVFPETHAAMTAYILAPERPAGLYATVDVGAGTTDVAFFWCGDQTREDGTRSRVASFHAAQSEFVGMDDVDRALGVTRAKREQLSKAQLTECQPIYAGVLERIFKQYGRTFRAAYKNATDQRYWVGDKREHHNGQETSTKRAKYRLCLVGGGTRMQEVVDRLKRPLDYLGFQTVDVDQPCLPDRIQILANKGQMKDVPVTMAQQLPLLLLAYGLAHRAIDIPLWEHGRGGRQELVYLPQITHEEIYG